MVAIPALQAQNPKDMERRAVEEQWYRFTKKVVPQTTLQRQKFVLNLIGDEEIPAGMARVTLAAGDVWEDGSGYQMLLDADANTYGTIIPETGGLTTYGDAPASTYAEFEYKIPENADGSMTTTNIVLDDAVTILIPAGTYDWCITNPTPDDRIWIASSNGNIGGRMDDYEFVEGATYVFTVSLGGSNDRVDLEILDPTAPVLPENLTAVPTATTADVAWENDHDQVFNLRYRVYNPNVAQNLTWDFDTEESLEGWSIYDADQDGYTWYWDEENGYLYSFSYYWGESLEPDNWLISPEVDLNGELSFWAGQASSSYPDNFAVYVCVGDVDIDADEPGIKISDDLAPTEWTKYTFDLSEYAGAKGHFIIRHYNCYDMYRLLIDDVTLTIPGDEPNEWIVVEGIEGTEYTIEGLTPETTYEVQVQAVGEDRRTTNWTESTLFTTLKDDVDPGYPTEGYYIVFIHHDGTQEIVELQQGMNGDYVDVFDLTYPTYHYNCPFFFLINGVAYGAPADETLAVLGNADENPLDMNENTYFVPVGYSYTLGIHFIYDIETLEFMGYSAYVVKGGPVEVEELNADKAVAGVRYYNMVGQEVAQPNGVTIQVTTYTDGTTSAVKVVK